MKVIHFWSADKYPYFSWGSFDECVKAGRDTSFSLTEDYAESFIDRLDELYLENKRQLEMVQRDSMRKLSDSLKFYMKNRL